MGDRVVSLKAQSEYILKLAVLKGDVANFIEGFQTLAIHLVRILNELLDEAGGERHNLEQIWAVMHDNLPGRLLPELKRTGAAEKP